MGIAILATLLMLILFMGLLAVWLERIDRRLAAVEKMASRERRPWERDLKLVAGKHN